MKTLSTAIAAVNETYSEPRTLKDRLQQAIMLHADKDGFLTDTRPGEVLESVMEAIQESVKEFVDKERN